MIDFDMTLDQMLDNIQWTSKMDPFKLSDLRDDKVYTLEEGHVSTAWRPSEYDILGALSDLCLKKFQQVSFTELYNDLVLTVKRGIGNAIKRGNKGDLTQVIVVDLYFTKNGVVISITDRGNGFDYKQTYSLFQEKAKYFTNTGGGFQRFAECKSVISYTNSGRTLLIQYCLDPAVAEKSMDRSPLATRLLTTSDLVRALPTAKNSWKLLSWLAKFGPQFLQSFWANPEFIEKSDGIHSEFGISTVFILCPRQYSKTFPT